MKFLFILLGLLLLSNSPLSALIGNTKHNLSATNTAGTIKAVAETEECVFCHIPHLARPSGSPLWNREMPVDSYSMYESDYLKRIDYPLATSLGTLTGQPGTLSRQCLSCHDGTIAIGSIYKLRQDIMNGASIVMAGTDADMMPSGSTNFGTDLTNHHPVGIAYDASVDITRVFGDGSSVTSELKAIPDSPIRLYDYGGTKYVECASCHDPHTENTKFLRMGSGTPATLHGTNVLNTCLACHEKEGWSGSAHQSANNVYTDSNVSTNYGVNTVAGLGCINCHTPHNGEGVPTLLRKVEENTCFQGAASSVGGAACHGTGGAKDIEGIITKTYAHPTLTTQGKHTGLDALYGEGHSEPDGEVGKGVDWSNSKHAECMDCHNPHKTQPGTHTPSGQWYPTTPNVNTNLVSNVLAGVNGVEPTWPVTGWTQPTTFTTLKSATKEYQICMKCHSYWGLGSATFGASSFNLSTEGTIVTDQAWEFNPNNRAAHPVVMTTNQMIANGGDRYSEPVEVAWMKPPWNQNVGNQTMYCSDCHGSDNEDTTDSKGPHGSSKPYMLKGKYKYWPEDPATGQPWLITDGVDKITGIDLVPAKEIFCQNCHVLNPTTANNSDKNTPHRIKAENAGSSIFGGLTFKCVNCHIAVPHGSPVSRMIGYYNFPEPYNYNGNSLQLTGFYAQNGWPKTFAKNAWLVDHDGTEPGYPPIDTTLGCGGSGSAWFGLCHGTSTDPANHPDYDPYIPIP